MHLTKLLYLIACDVSKLIDGNVLVQVGPQHDGLAVARGLQDPHLLLLQRLAVRVGPVPEGLRAQVLEFAVDEPDGPAALVRGRGAAVAAVTIATDPVQAGHGGN